MGTDCGNASTVVTRPYLVAIDAATGALDQGFAPAPNGLVRAHHWEVGLSKTGYISEAGRCLVMRVKLASKDLIVVLLDSWGKQSRIGDANRIKKWVETHAATGRTS